MPIRRRRNVKKPRKPRARKSGGSGLKSVAMSAARGLGGLALKVMKSKLGLNTESKYIDAVTAGYVATTTLAAFTANTGALIAQGNTTSTRNGDQIRMSSFELDGVLYNGAANTMATTCRFIIVHWYCPQPQANLADVLQVTTDINSPYTIDPAQRHTILHDQKHYFGPYNAGSTPTAKLFSYNYRPLSHHIRWTVGDTTGAQANVLEGYIACYFYSDGFTIGNAPVINWYQRVRYVDN